LLLWNFSSQGNQCATPTPTAKEPTPIATIGPTTPGTEVWWKVRLPHNVVPDHYDVELNIDLDKLEFNGSVTILVTVREPTENVLVHVNKMNITSASVEKASSGGKLKHMYSLRCTGTVLIYKGNHVTMEDQSSS